MAKKNENVEKIKEKLLKFSWTKKILVGVFLLLLIFSFYHAYFGNKIIPGVTVGNISIGGKTATKALETLVESLEEEEILTLKDTEQDTIYEIKTSQIELEYDLSTTIKEAFKIGRSGNFWKDSKIKLQTLIKPREIETVINFNEALLQQRLSEIKGMVDQPAKDAEFYLDEKNNLRIQTDQRGRKISSSSLYQIVIQSLVKVDFSEKELPITTEEAKVTAQNLETIKEKIEPLLEKSLLVQHKNNTWELEPEDKLNYITIKKIEGNLNPALNNKTFNAYAEKIAREINALPRGEVTKETEDGKVLEFEIIEKGEEVDVNAFRKEFEQALLNNSEKITVTTIPTDNSSDLEKYGILALLGRGESDYSGSIPSRIHNLTLAAERASGALVPPGEVFSLNEAVGPINGATGYNSAWVIANGRTVLGSGGGVCQTSTTMFRAALNSGLPVVERHPHAYRVSYYENDMPLGFDASIYQPALDFKFKNDTPNYVLVQAETIPEENKLAFRIYGTPDGRKVEITEPNIYGVSPAPAPRYEETDDLPKGTTKQVDFAAPGGTSVFSRTVTKNGEVLFEETYKSVYRPWQAIFLVGTKTD